MLLRIEIVDSDCSAGEAHIHRVDIRTEKIAIVNAVATFYPTATSILMEVEEE